MLIVLGAGMGLSAVLDVDTTVFARFLQLWLLATWAAFVAGWWALTVPDAGQLTTSRGQRPRVIVRGTVALSSCVVLAAFVIGMFGHPGARTVMALSLANLAAVGIGFFASMLYVRWLASRAPSQRIAERAANLMKAIAVLMAFNLLLFAKVDGLTVLVVFLTGITCLIVLSYYCNMFSWLRAALKSVVEQGGSDPTPVS
jgi:hypothetical protein